MNPCTHFCFKRIHILNDSVAADVSVINAAAYSTLGVTTAAIAEAAATDVKGVSVMCFFCMNSYLI